MEGQGTHSAATQGVQLTERDLEEPGGTCSVKRFVGMGRRRGGAQPRSQLLFNENKQIVG
jgi:hypothetical protein